jgi:telomere length regulation protein
MASSEDDTEAIVKALTSQPSQEDLTQALARFEPSSTSATPSAASVVFEIVNTTVPELWRSLRSNTRSNRTVHLIVSCLSSVSGVNALLMKLDQLHARVQHLSSQNDKHQLEDVLEILTLILENDKFSPARVISAFNKIDAQEKMLLSEYISLVGGSKILNVVAKSTMDFDGRDIWISEGKRYSKWLGKRLAIAIKAHPDVPELSTILGKALNIGYPSIHIPFLR